MSHRCPRRDENPQSDQVFPGPDKYNPTCSYCGSISPEAFLQALKDGVELGPTDKNYKAYIKAGGGIKFYYQHLSDEQKHEFIDLLNAKTVNFGYPGHLYVLPYFVA